MEDLKTWFENHKSSLGVRWQREVAKTLSASQEYDWPGLFELLGRGIGADEKALPGAADALRAWVVARSPAQRVPLPDLLAATFLLRVTITDSFQELKEASVATEWLTQVSAYLDRMAIQAVDVFARNVDRIVADRLAEAKFLSERTLKAAEEADQVLVKLRAMHQVSLTLSPSLELELLLELIVEQLVQNTPAEACAIWLEKDGALHGAAHYGLDDEAWPVWQESLTAAGTEGLVHHVFEQGSRANLSGDAGAFSRAR